MPSLSFPSFPALAVDRILRGHWDTPQTQRGRATSLQIATMVIIFGLFYGAMMGTFSGLWGDRLLQIVYSAIKVPLLLGVTFFVALPSFWVVNRLMGLGDDFPCIFHGLVATQATLTIILAALAPFTAFWYCSSADYQGAILFNALAFAIASVAAQWRLSQYYRPLIAQNRRHKAMQAMWLILYAFVGIQMGWTLRPFIGDPTQPAQFFRSEPFTNAYVVIVHLLLGIVR